MDAIPQRPKPATRPIRRWIVMLHRWAGIVLGLWIVVLGLTGSALVYQHSLRQVIEQGRSIQPGLPPLPVDDLLIRVRQQRPDVTLLAVRGFQYSDSALEVLIRPTNATRGVGPSRILLVDPGTGSIQATQSSAGTLMGFLAQLHFNLLLGDIGLTLNALAGALTIFYVITGLILWWRGRTKWKNGLLLRVKGKSARALTFNLHSFLGFYASLFLVLTGFSGTYFAFPKAFVSIAARAQGVPPSIVKDYLASRSSDSMPGTPDAPATRVMAEAQAQFPHSRITQLTLPLQPTDPWCIQLTPEGKLDTGNSQVVLVDRRSAKVIVAKRTDDLPIAVRAVLFLRPLHTGGFGGNVTRALWFLLGGSPAILFVSGLCMWRQRLASKASATKRTTTLPV